MHLLGSQEARKGVSSGGFSVSGSATARLLCRGWRAFTLTREQDRSLDTSQEESMTFAQGSMSAGSFPVAGSAAESARVAFVKKTYAHLAGAIGAFVLLEAFLLNIPGVENVIGALSDRR
jgi:hypothetical protein